MANPAGAAPLKEHPVRGALELASRYHSPDPGTAGRDAEHRGRSRTRRRRSVIAPDFRIELAHRRLAIDLSSAGHQAMHDTAQSCCVVSLSPAEPSSSASRDRRHSRVFRGVLPRPSWCRWCASGRQCCCGARCAGRRQVIRDVVARLRWGQRPSPAPLSWAPWPPPRRSIIPSSAVSIQILGREMCRIGSTTLVLGSVEPR